MTVQEKIDVSTADMQAVLDRQKAAYLEEGPVSAEVRIDRLNRLIDLVHDHKDEMVVALSKDFGHRSSHQTLMSDIYSTLESLKHTKKSLKSWMKPEKRKAPVPMNIFGARARIEYQPKGVIGILGTWNFPIHTVVSPLAGIFAAGNRALIKYSEVTPETSALMHSLIKKYYKEEECAGFLGGPEVGAAFSGLPLDHLIFTGATSIARHVMRSASENLTPVTLELGGKSPVIISREADLKEAARRIFAGKTLNVGQVCLSPDYVFVPEDLREEFLAHAFSIVAEMFPTMLSNPDYCSVINERHYQRLQGYIQDAKDKGGDVREINPGNEDFSQQQGVHKIPLTLIVDPSTDMKVSQDELFGPLLCVKSYKKLDECIDYINANPRPLALYYFGPKKGPEVRKVLDNTTSGGVCINDVMAHVSCEDLPFGGVGHSGMGNYHGPEGFKTFSHARSVFTQTKINLQALGGMLPPYGEKADKTLAGMIKK
ncbi:coniferyl aldehyde dehydrogenase [Endozoicomonas arenosclerae]|uniref:coniferyl aldehyde dehydrogenase n=1 Tax=Endozoicomonas arenosclerae TaxID=1633495 RepID=UPI0007857FEC|nr:coniferyl aldehyde dehydrogenase [Endozoicomonas arenosclerae]